MIIWVLEKSEIMAFLFDTAAWSLNFFLYIQVRFSFEVNIAGYLYVFSLNMNNFIHQWLDLMRV